MSSSCSTIPSFFSSFLSSFPVLGLFFRILQSPVPPRAVGFFFEGDFQAIVSRFLGWKTFIIPSFELRELLCVFEQSRSSIFFSFFFVLLLVFSGLPLPAPRWGLEFSSSLELEGSSSSGSSWTAVLRGCLMDLNSSSSDAGAESSAGSWSFSFQSLWLLVDERFKLLFHEVFSDRKFLTQVRHEVLISFIQMGLQVLQDWRAVVCLFQRRGRSCCVFFVFQTRSSGSLLFGIFVFHWIVYGILELCANELIERSSSVSARGASRHFEASPLVVRVFILR